MKNAHLRFGHLTYTKVFKKSTTRFRLPLDRFIGESEQDSQVKAHLISAIGGDTQIAALSAAVANRDYFMVEAADGTSFRISLGTNAECYRGSLAIEGSKRPLRHVVAVSEELAQAGSAKNDKNKGHTILIDGSPRFVWTSLAHLHGIPGIPEWATWIVNELDRMKAIKTLVGIGCSPILIEASKGLLMSCISRGIRSGELRFPAGNGPIQWNVIPLIQLLLPGGAPPFLKAE